MRSPARIFERALLPGVIGNTWPSGGQIRGSSPWGAVSIRPASLRTYVRVAPRRRLLEIGAAVLRRGAHHRRVPGEVRLLERSLGPGSPTWRLRCFSTREFATAKSRNGSASQPRRSAITHEGSACLRMNALRDGSIGRLCRLRTTPDCQFANARGSSVFTGGPGTKPFSAERSNREVT